MISLILSFLVLIGGYFIYGRLIERVFGPDDRETPAYTKQDGVDFTTVHPDTHFGRPTRPDSRFGRPTKTPSVQTKQPGRTDLAG